MVEGETAYWFMYAFLSLSPRDFDILGSVLHNSFLPDIPTQVPLLVARQSRLPGLKGLLPTLGPQIALSCITG